MDVVVVVLYPVPKAIPWIAQIRDTKATTASSDVLAIYQDILVVDKTAERIWLCGRLM